MIRYIGVFAICGISILCIVFAGVIVFIDAEQQLQAEATQLETRAITHRLLNISTEIEELSALFRKIDGAQNTDPIAIQRTNVAIDQALSSRKLSDLNELRLHLDALNLEYSEVNARLHTLVSVNPKQQEN